MQTMKHQFKPGEKEAVASILGIAVEDMPDTLDLGGDEEIDEEEIDEEDEEEDEDEEDEDDEEDDDEDEEDSDEDEEAEDSNANVELLKLRDEWKKDFENQMLFSEFLKHRGR